jgi:TssR protein N-terminal barrel domain/TssR protein VWA domain/TssR C-terminal domain
MRTVRIYITILVFAFVGNSSVTAQFCSGMKRSPKRVLGLPESFENPVDYWLIGRYDRALKETKDYGDAPWIIFSDRENNQTYKGSSGTDKCTTLKWMESYYVIDESPERIHLAQARIEKGLNVIGQVVDMGWIDKKNVLLWGNGLVDPLTRIHQKVFTVNNANDVVQALKSGDLVKIYKGPDKTFARNSDVSINDFFFILKKENDMILIGRSDKVHKGNAHKVEGWVYAKRCATWNTRIALEPNFTPEAYEERQSDPKKRIVAFKELEAAKKAIEFGFVDVRSKVFERDSDPCAMPDSLKSAENPMRWKGNVMRYAMLSTSQGEVRDINSKVYLTGAIGELTFVSEDMREEFKMDESEYANIIDELRGEATNKSNYNLLFIIEGTRAMSDHKDKVIATMRSAIESLREVDNLNVSATIYRHAQSSKAVEMLPLTGDTVNLFDFINATQFGSGDIQSPYTCLNYGINYALENVGVNKNHTNIVVVIGDNADYSTYRMEREVARRNGDKRLIKPSVVREALLSVGAHLHFIQLENDGAAPTEDYVRQARTYVIESLKSRYNQYSSGEGMEGLSQKDKGPYLTDQIPGRVIKSENGSLPGSVYTPDGQISERQLPFIGQNMIGSSKIFVDEFILELERYASGAREFDGNTGVPDFSPAMKHYIYRQLKDGNFNASDLKAFMNKPYKLYNLAWVPYKYNKSKYPLVSYVLFMPRNDLERYIELLEDVTNTAASSTTDMRKGLRDAFVGLYREFSGDNMSDKDIRNLSIEDLNNKIQGLSNEGLENSESVFSGSLGKFKIEDLTRKSAISDRQIEAYIDRLRKTTKRLDRIHRMSVRYEYHYRSAGEGDIYYWIPIEDAFF